MTPICKLILQNVFILDISIHLNVGYNNLIDIAGEAACHRAEPVLAWAVAAVDPVEVAVLHIDPDFEKEDTLVVAVHCGSLVLHHKGQIAEVADHNTQVDLVAAAAVVGNSRLAAVAALVDIDEVLLL